MICIKCGKDNGENWKFCRYCGAKAEEPKMENTSRYCHECGAKLDSDSIFCSSCGTKVSDTESEPAKKRYFCANCNAEFDEDTMFCNKCGHKLIDGQDSHELTAHANYNSNCKYVFEAKHIYNITGKGVVIMGVVKQGEITAVTNGVVVQNGSTKNFTITGIEKFYSPIKTATLGNVVSLITEGVQKEDLRGGDLICDSLNTYSSFVSETQRSSDNTGTTNNTANNTANNTSDRNPTPSTPGNEVVKFHLSSRYLNNDAFHKGSGDLIFYENCVEFKKKLNVLSGFVCFDKTPIKYYYNEIESYSIGTKLAVYPAVILKLKNGETETYTIASLDSDKKSTVDSLLRKNIK